MICHKGFDNRSRFFAITAIAILGFSLFSKIFTAYFFLSLIILLGFALAITFSTTRRFRDASLPTKWQFFPGIIFMTTGIIILLLDNPLSYWLLLLPCISCAVILTYPSQSCNLATSSKNKSYIHGYHGPVDLSEYQQSSPSLHLHNKRIEPTLTGPDLTRNDANQAKVKPTANVPFEHRSHSDEQRSINEQIDMGEQIRLAFLHNKKLQIAILGIAILTILAVLTHAIFSKVGVTQQDPVQHTTSPTALLAIADSEKLAVNIIKSDALAMPDNFNLYFTQHKGLVIHWQADEMENGLLWSQLSTLNDNSCQTIQFHKGKKIRTLAVNIENTSDYFSYFSPLDSKELIRALAFKTSFSLCGYNFSLKGSQAALGKRIPYAEFIN